MIGRHNLILTMSEFKQIIFHSKHPKLQKYGIRILNETQQVRSHKHKITNKA